MLTLLNGDARAVLRTLPAASANVCCTSPPYFGLRSYGTAPQDWEDGFHGELGGEPTVAGFLAHLVETFREVRRVLHPTGCLFVNLGDSMATGGGTAPGARSVGIGQATAEEGYSRGPRQADLPAGNLLLVPHRFAQAMQRDGWTLRSAMVLTKSAPMPESVQGVRWERCRVKVAAQWGGDHPHPSTVDGLNYNRGKEVPPAEWAPCPGCPRCEKTGGLVLRWGSGRPTSAYEMLFVFSQGGAYFWNSEAVRRPPPTYDWTPARGQNSFPNSTLRNDNGRHGGGQLGLPNGGNALNWLAWQPAPLADAHYAAFPPFIPEFCIKAGTPPEVCGKCRAPYAPVVERETVDERRAALGLSLARSPKQANGDNGVYHRAGPGGGNSHDGTRCPAVTLHGWLPTCTCAAPSAPAVVLDPFGGAGTTGMVADRLGRDAIGIDLNPTYSDLARKRLTDDAGLFADLAPPAEARSADQGTLAGLEP